MLYGRDEEQRRIAALLAGAREGRSGALVLRGEAGIGKTALLDAVVEPGLRVLRATGVEAEAELAFAGLSQLLWPVRDRLDALPEPHAAALHGALGTVPAERPDRFAAGLALLTLLADLAETEPVLCLVDDAHWLDAATAESLQFAARRLTAERVVLLVAVRDDCAPGACRVPCFPFAGLPELVVDRLAPADADRLLAARGLPAARRTDVIRQSAGNPLALVEFGAPGSAFPGGPAPLPVADRVLAGYQARIARLPEQSRWMLLLAAAEGRGHLSSLLTAAAESGASLADLAPAERDWLVAVTGSTLFFRHPLIRAAAYQSAPADRRVAAHRVLAATAENPDCRVRHRASAAIAPDEEVAAELSAGAERARSRGGHGTAAALYRRAAELSPDAADRVRRIATAAELHLLSGHPGEAEELALGAEGLTDDPVETTRLVRVRAAVEFERGDTRTAARMLVDRAAHTPSGEVVPLLRTAALYGWTSGTASAVCAADARLRAAGLDDRFVRGLARMIEGAYADGVPPLAAHVADALAASPASPDRPDAVQAALAIGADDAVAVLTAEEIAHHRRRGLLGALPALLHAQARVQLERGLHGDAAASVEEAAALARDTGLTRRAGRLAAAHARLAAIEGDEARVRAAEDAVPGGAFAQAALALLDLGSGRPDETVRRLAPLVAGPRRHAAGMMSSIADLAEAAVRLGRPDEARPAAVRLRAWADATGQPWALALALRCAALLDDAEDPYLRALDEHTRADRPFEAARTELLYGEWLRRHRRRADARRPLRSALETFERLRAAPWAERARGELRATGEAVTLAPDADALDRLTPQERQVVRLAAAGTSSREIAAQLFLSPRTVEYHLYKAYPKLGVSSRRELAGLELVP
ncbi:putative HTH-type transcriptional regulator [Actinomadura rubteroloni]|uniref:Putative HTH-type transcriptional regulator n=1 Tax=Actinomadura rubteroloni TaxID=1926885 RepID=A0A2P4UP06_9ACTN|nr:LuxR family transcriptional regulator [Actinomadura rubteroloni]POM26772.1 putative HTH-type transcriptional regulator [Actinomadura rubteroloni]